VPLHCINTAAIEYHIPARLLISILQIERGKIGQIIKNANGTYDIGPAQINSTWLPKLKEYSITQDQIQFDPCINIKIASWILAKYIASENNLLVGIGNFNSHTQQYNQRYYQKIRLNYTKLHLLLD
jgi:soluble lytic murein transglycosylase-like protein